jgi:hypothetical protein
MAKRLLRAAKIEPPIVAAPPPRLFLTAAKRRTPGQPVDLSQLRAKLSKASGGSIPLVPKHSNEAVVERYAGRVKNRGSAIRAKCIDCSCGMIAEVSRCTVSHCALHLFRDGTDPFRAARSAGEDPPPQPVPFSSNETLLRYYGRIRNRGTAIRSKCMECMNGQQSLVASCESTKCALHPFRMGSDPLRQQRAAGKTVSGEEEQSAVDTGDDHDEDDCDVCET